MKAISANNTHSGWFSRQAEKFEAARFGWMTILITFQSCLGSVACMYILQNTVSDWLLAVCSVVTMSANAMFIAQAPAKYCLSVFYLSVFTNTVLLLSTCFL